MTLALLLIGAPGAGKSSTLEALGSELERAEIPYGSIESEQLSMGWPLLPATTWIPTLSTILHRQVEAGRTLFLITATPESPSELTQLQSSIPASTLHTVCLVAPADTVASRLDTREPDTWPGKQRLILHARDLADQIPTFPGITTTISTETTTAPSTAQQLFRDFLSRD
jgi:GTPase SAR1 family protein